MAGIPTVGTSANSHSQGDAVPFEELRKAHSGLVASNAGDTGWGEQGGSEARGTRSGFTAGGAGNSAGPGLSRAWARSHGCCRRRLSCSLHLPATTPRRCAPRPCCSSSACTRRSSCASMWRSLPSTTCSSWSTPTRHPCCLEPTRTQVWWSFIRCLLSTRCDPGSGLDPGNSWVQAEPCPAPPRPLGNTAE